MITKMTTDAGILAAGAAATLVADAGLAVIKAIGALRHRLYARRTGAQLIVRTDRRNITGADYFLAA